MKIRGKRRYYRLLKARIRDFNHHLSEENSWYNMWHIHFDWFGISEKVKDRRSHIKHYIELLQKINASDLSNSKPFQAWIFLDSVYPIHDALYLHTSNPHSSFPFINQDIAWLNDEKEIPEILINVNISLYTFDRLRMYNFTRFLSLGDL